MSLTCDTCSTTFEKEICDQPNFTILYEKDGQYGPSHCCQDCARQIGNINGNLEEGGWFETNVFESYTREENRCMERNCPEKKRLKIDNVDEESPFLDRLKQLVKEAESLKGEEWEIWNGIDEMKQLAKATNKIRGCLNFDLGKPCYLKVDDTFIIVPWKDRDSVFGEVSFFEVSVKD